MQTLQPELQTYILELASVNWSSDYLRQVCQVGEPSSDLGLMPTLRSRATILKISDSFGGFWQSLLWGLKESGERELVLDAYRSASYFIQAKSCAKLEKWNFRHDVNNRLWADIVRAELWDNTVCFFLDKDTVMFFVFVVVDGKVGIAVLKVELGHSYPFSGFEKVLVKRGVNDQWLLFDTDMVNQAWFIGLGLTPFVHALISLTLPKLKRMGCLIFENQRSEFEYFFTLTDIRQTDGLDVVLMEAIDEFGMPGIPNMIHVRNLNTNTRPGVPEIVSSVNSGDEEEMVVLIEGQEGNFRKLTCRLGLAHLDHLVQLNDLLSGIPNSRYIGNNNVFVTGFLEKNVKGLTIVREVPCLPDDDSCLPDE